MRKLLFAAILLSGVAFAQGAPHMFLQHQTSVGLCGTVGSFTPCSSTTTASLSQAPFNGMCATIPKQTSGTFAGYGVEFCTDDQSVTVLKVQYDSAGTIPQSATVYSQTDTRLWVQSHLYNAKNPQANLPLHEGGPIFDPYIGTIGGVPCDTVSLATALSNGCGAWVIVGGACLTTDACASRRGAVWVSTSLDPTIDASGCPSNCGWNVLVQSSGSTAESGDFFPRVSYSSQALYFIGISSAGTGTTDNVYAWGSNSLQTMNQLSNAGVLPAPDVTWTQLSSPAFSAYSFPVFDETAGKLNTTDYLVSLCDAHGSTCVSTSNYQSQVTLNAITWSSPTAATLTKTTVNTPGAFVNAGGAHCWASNTSTALGGGEMMMPGNTAQTTGSPFTNYYTGTATTADAGNSRQPGYAAYSNGHIYLSQPFLCTATSSTAAAQKPNGSWMLDYNVAGSSVTILDTIGAGAQGTNDYTNPAQSMDAYGNVYWVMNASSPTLFLSPVVYYLAKATGTMAGPYILNAPQGTGSISGNTCSTFTPTSPVLPQQYGLIISGSYAGQVNFKDNTGAAISAQQVGVGHDVTATSTTNAGSQVWTFPGTGSMPFVQACGSSWSSGTANLTWSENYGSSRNLGSVNSGSTPTELNALMELAEVDHQNEYVNIASVSCGITNDKGAFATCGVFFTAHYPTSISIGGGAPTVLAGNTTPAFTGSTSFIDASTTSGVAEGGLWSSDNTAVATVNASTGVATGVSAGTANISYTVMGVASAGQALQVVTPCRSGGYCFPAGY